MCFWLTVINFIFYNYFNFRKFCLYYLDFCTKIINNYIYFVRDGKMIYLDIKKIFFIILIVLISYTVFSDEVLITEISDPENLKGSDFFPLFVGGKWVWTVQGNSEVNEIVWEIKSSHIINYKTMFIENVLGFKMVVTGNSDGQKVFTEERYLFEFDGYICSLIPSGKTYELHRMIPVDPRIEDEWMNNDEKFNVAVVEENMVKVEYITDDASRYGYYMFISDVGPYKIYDYLTGGSDTKYTEMTIIDNVSYTDLGKVKDKKTADKKDDEVVKEDTVKDEEVVKEDTKKDEEVVKENTVKDEEVEKEDDKEEEYYADEEEDKYDVIDDDYLDKLVKGKKYVQIGAYSILDNAAEMMNKSREYGYKTKIYIDDDGFYKVLILVDSNESAVIKQIKKSFVADAFFKYEKDKK